MFASHTSGVSCFEPMMIKFQNKYNTQWESLWLFVFFQVCQIIQLKLFAQQKSNTPGFMIHKTRPIKRTKSQTGHNFLISCKTVTEQRLKTRLEKSASGQQFVTIVNTIRGGGLSAQCALYKITDSEGWPGPKKQLTDNIFKGMTSLVYFMQWGIREKNFALL